MSPQEHFNDPAIEKEEDLVVNVKEIPKLDPNWKYDFVWPYLVFMVSLHVLSLVGLYYAIMGVKWQTYLFTYIVFQIAQFGFTAGIHRYFAHKSFKAKMPTRIFLMLASTLSFTGPSIKWARDHRQHHKYSDTEADPYNSRRGFIYSHLGWVTNRKSAFVRKMGKTIDVSDCLRDPIQVFQRKHYWWMMPILTFILPTIIPIYCWNEGILESIFFATIFRHCLSLNVSASINSWAHKFGNRPYDKNIEPADHKIISFISSGECFHNYHHTFPFDYRSSEYPQYALSMTNIFLDSMIKIGQIYDAKTASVSMIEKRSIRTGDGSRFTHKE